MNEQTATATTKRPAMVALFAAASANGYPNWNPTAHPYRVSYDRPSHYDGRMLSETAVFATEAEAREVLAAMMPKCASRATLDLAVNGEQWCERGRWKRIASRKRGSSVIR